MARRLLLGRAGTGKTHACLDLLTQALARGERPLLVVPTYAQAEHLRFALVDRAGGLSEHTVKTFEQLAEDLTALRLGDLAPAPVKDLAAERALAEDFPEACRRPGLRAEFLAAVKEIKEQGEPVAATLERARAHFPEGARGRRLFEAYARYTETLAQPDHEDLLLRARDRLAAEPRPLDLLLVDGFHDFTPVQRSILDHLAAAARDTVVTLPLDPDQRAHPIFATAARTAAAFRGYREEALRENRRAKGLLAELECRLFTLARGRVRGPGLETLVCPSDEDEADRVARFVAASGRPCNDFLLVRRSFGDLQPLWRAAFRRYGIPLRFYAPESFAKGPAARAATLWLRTLTEEVDAAELLPLLRSPFFLKRPGAEEVDAFAADLRTRKLPAPPACVRPRDGDLARLVRTELGVRDALVAVPDGDEEIARAARLFALLAQEAEAVAHLPLQEAAPAVLRRLPLLRAKQHDRRHDCVYAVDALDARQWEKQVVVVTGLDAQSFPRQVRQDLFLRDEERTRLAEERGLHLPLRSRKEDEERYLFYVALTRARERLVLTRAGYDEQGVARAASPYLEETLRHFVPEKERVLELSEQYAAAGDAVRPADLFPLVADGLRHASPLAASLYAMGAVDRAELAWPHRLELARTRPLGPPAAEGPVRLSPSSINRYLKCPYLFLLDKVLRVERPRGRELDPLLRGNIVHEALERYANERTDAGAIFDEVFGRDTEGMRLGLDGEAHRRWMRAAVVRAAGEMERAPVEVPEGMFEIDVAGARLRGRIDRIDRYPAGRVVRDYKTGSAGLDTSIQLEAYMLAVEEPAGAVFELLREGRVKGFALAAVAPELGVDAVSPAELAARLEKARDTIRAVAEGVRAGRLAVHPREPEECKRTKCDGYDVCRVARARWLAKAARAKEEPA